MKRPDDLSDRHMIVLSWINYHPGEITRLCRDLKDGLIEPTWRRN